MLAKDVAANPWTVAKTRAGMTGAVLADLIARTDEPAFVLVGHSLGARVMATAAQLLGTTAWMRPKLEDVHLLGAAVGRQGRLAHAQRRVTGTVWNYWSSNDSVLKYLYAVGSVGERAAGQGGFETKFPKIKNRNVSRSVDGHSAYFGAISLADASEMIVSDQNERRQGSDGDIDAGQRAPYDRRAAVETILLEDESLTGRIYRYDDSRGRAPAEIAEAEDNQGVAFVYNYRLQIDALLSGEVPTSPWAARSVAAKLRRWLKTLELERSAARRPHHVRGHAAEPC